METIINVFCVSFLALAIVAVILMILALRKEI
jgi:hypothetical protein